MLQKIPVPVVKSTVCAILMGPFVWLAWRLVDGDLGAQPAEEMNHQLGLWALRLLTINLIWGSLLALGWVPMAARRLTYLRRHLGVVGFVYAFGHLAFYFVKEGDLELALTQMFTKVYLIIGLTSFTILLTLTITSADWAVRRLRKRWKTLHRLVYVAIGLSVIHFQLIEKKDWTDALPFLLPLAVLYVARVIKVIAGRAKPALRRAR